MPTEHAKIRNEARARRLLSALALAGSMLLGGAGEAAAVPTTTGNHLPSAAEPTSEVDDSEVASGGIPNVLLYGAVAGFFLLVAAGLGAHRKH